MRKALRHAVVTSARLLIAATCVSCSGQTNVDEAAPGVESAPPKIDDATAGRAVQAALAHPDARALDSLPQADTEQVLGTEKIRNGSNIGYSNLVGNGVVFILANTSQGTAICSAQVINRWFLLTAAHCVSALLASGSGNLVVAFTNSSGTLVPVYAGSAFGGVQPNARPSDRDTGVIFLPNAMTTCQGQLSQCSSSQPNVPENAVFQYFRPNTTLATASSYVITGYGATDDQSTGSGTLRAGSMAAAAAGFTDSQSFAFIMNWTNNGQQRSCAGDSGSPLVAGVSGRLLYTGIASHFLTAGGCTATSGSISYSGLSDTQGAWVLSQVLGIRNQLGLVFDCTAATSGNLSVFACDNDGSIY